MQDNEKYILQSVDNALMILELFGQHKELGVSEVAELMGIGKSTAFRTLTTLENRKYLYKMPNAKYSLGLKIYSLGHIVKNRIAIKDLVQPDLIKLSKMTGETAHLVVWYDERQVIFVDKVLSSSSIRMDSYVGFIMDAHLTASGKSLLSVLPDDKIRQYSDHMVFVQKTPKTIMTAAALFEEIYQVRRQGFSIDDEESELGLICYAAPIVDKMGTGIAAVSISGPAHRMIENRDNCAACIKQVAAEISDKL